MAVKILVEKAVDKLEIAARSHRNKTTFRFFTNKANLGCLMQLSLHYC